MQMSRSDVRLSGHAEGPRSRCEIAPRASNYALRGGVPVEVATIVDDDCTVFITEHIVALANGRTDELSTEEQHV